MPHNRLAKMSGVHPEQIRSHLDHNPRHEVVCANMTDGEMRKFLREEEKEVAHVDLKGKHF